MQQPLRFALILFLVLASAASTAIAEDTERFVADSTPGGITDNGSSGAVRVSKDPHWLEFRGKPILAIGDSVTHGWSECGTDFDQRAYLDALAARGMNIMLLWSYTATSRQKQLADRRVCYDSPEIWPWPGSADRRDVDLNMFNPAFLERLREFVEYANGKDIVVVITVQDGWPKTHFAHHPFNAALGNGPLTERRQLVELADYDHEMPATFDAGWTWQQKNQYFQERYAAKLCETLADCSNVIFEMFNEGEWYDKEQRRRHEEHFLRFFRSRTSAPLMSNVDHIRFPAFRPRENSAVDIISLHKQPWTGQHATFVKEFLAEPVRVIVESEPVPAVGGLEPAQRGHALITREIVRRTVWERALSGAGFIAQNDTSFGWNPRCGMAAPEFIALRDDVYDILGHAARFFDQSEVAFWKMNPQGALSSSGLCLAQPGEEYVVYVLDGQSFTVDLSAVPTGALDARWYNPATGEFQKSANVPGGDSRQSFAPPLSGDAVLHLRRATR